MNWPYVFGQSGTARPEPVLVTIPPAAINSTVDAATSFEYRCSQTIESLIPNPESLILNP
jgi:hypothetical protein